MRNAVLIAFRDASRRFFLAFVLVSFSGCSLDSTKDETETLSCNQEILFGMPSETTGLTTNECKPSCSCGQQSWQPPSYSEEDITALEELTLLDGPGLLAENPYDLSAAPVLNDTQYCGVLLEGPQRKQYRLVTYTSESAAMDAGARITHRGGCGQCSSLENLAVYMRNPDLTEPVRSCGILGMTQGETANMQCLMDIGFDEPCAQIWYFNTTNTRTQCLDICFALLESPSHNTDGSLNACIQCDEEVSGPIFKAVSGRTRRNSGLPSALCRPCDSVYQLVHTY